MPGSSQSHLSISAGQGLFWLVLAVLPGFASGQPRLPDTECSSFYSGQIEPALAVEFFLTRDDTTVFGSYRYLEEEVRLHGRVDPATGAVELREYVPTREGGERSAGHFAGRFEADGSFEGRWGPASGRLEQAFHLRLGGVLRSGPKPPFSLQIEAAAPGGDGNLRGWLVRGRELYDLGIGCVHQSFAAMSAPEFETLEVQTLPGQPELIRATLGMTLAPGSERRVHRIFAARRSEPILEFEESADAAGQGRSSTRFMFEYRDSLLSVMRIDERFGPYGGPRSAERLSPACTEQREERIGRWRIQAEGALVVPIADPEPRMSAARSSELISPVCEGDVVGDADPGPAVVIRRVGGLAWVEINPNPETGQVEASCWLAGQPGATGVPPPVTVPPAEQANAGLTAVLPLTARWPLPGSPRAVAVFLDPGSDGLDVSNADLILMYDQSTRVCFHRFVQESGPWGSPMDAGLFRLRFGQSRP